MVKTFRVSLLFVWCFLLPYPQCSGARPEGAAAVIGPAGTNVIWDVALATDTTSHTFIEMMFPAWCRVKDHRRFRMAESWDIRRCPHLHPSQASSAGDLRFRR